MGSSILQNQRFHEFLLEIDRDLAGETRRQGCRCCGAALHSACYPRKPRGVPQGLPADYAVRFSFCCSADGCRRRHAPPSARFLGPKVFVGVAVLLITAMRQGPTPRGRRELSRMFHVSPRTLSRWRAWWQAIFSKSEFWRRMKARFVPPIPDQGLPARLLDCFQGRTLLDECLYALKFLSPMPRAWSPSMRADADPQRMAPMQP